MTHKTLNMYGDKDIVKKSIYGHDISSQRLDELDRFALSCLLVENKKTFLDIGCGEARVGLTASMMAYKTILIDIVNISEKIDRFLSVVDANVEFMHMDARHITCEHIKDIDIAYSQRFIHYLTFEEAQKLLSCIYACSCHGAYLCISASGLNSELGVNYRGLHVPVEDRYFHLSDAASEKHNIRGKVCLYSANDLRHLALSSKYKEEKIFVSEFGNIKGVFRK